MEKATARGIGQPDRVFGPRPDPMPGPGPQPEEPVGPPDPWVRTGPERRL